MGDPLLDGFRRLADHARDATGERELLGELQRLLEELDGVSTVAVSEGDGADHDGHFTAPVHANGDVAFVVAVDGPAVPRPTVRALAASASASLTARRAVKEARVDTLTRLLNRSALDAVMADEIMRAEAAGPGLAVLMLDLDDFKSINDELGHSTGDAVLREIGTGLAGAVRACDHVARLGGDEFVVLQPGGDPGVVMATAARLRRVIGHRAEAVVGRSVGASVGIAHWTAGQHAPQLLDRADTALRRAKRDGKGQVAAASSIKARDRIEVDEPWPELDHALCRRDLTTLFQPIRDLAHDRIVGYEALTRGPGRLERPDVLLAHARVAGRLIELDEQLREHSFATATDNGVRAPLTLFVNIEPETLVAMAEQPELWQRHGEPFPSVAEVTERALFARPGRLIAACDRLRELGWGIALDDVGQDPRALALLPLLSPDVIKLDLRLLRERPPSELSAVLMAVTAEAQRSGARVVAEGIESDDHLDRARGLGATLGQGYHLGRPGPLPAVDVHLDGHTPLPRSWRPSAPEGITPFNLVAGRSAAFEADAELIRELQSDMERRAIGLGPVATIACSLPELDLDPGQPSRLRHLADDVGFALLLADGPDEDSEAFLRRALPAGHALREEWITVVACPQYALTLVARRMGSDRWHYALSHDHALGIQTAQRLMLELDAV